jgi:hypothetical protein
MCSALLSAPQRTHETQSYMGMQGRKLNILPAVVGLHSMHARGFELQSSTIKLPFFTPCGAPGVSARPS